MTCPRHLGWLFYGLLVFGVNQVASAQSSSAVLGLAAPILQQRAMRDPEFLSEIGLHLASSSPHLRKASSDASVGLSNNPVDAGDRSSLIDLVPPEVEPQRNDSYLAGDSLLAVGPRNQVVIKADGEVLDTDPGMLRLEKEERKKPAQREKPFTTGGPGGNAFYTGVGAPENTHLEVRQRSANLLLELENLVSVGERVLVNAGADPKLWDENTKTDVLGFIEMNPIFRAAPSRDPFSLVQQFILAGRLTTVGGIPVIPEDYPFICLCTAEKIENGECDSAQADSCNIPPKDKFCRDDPSKVNCSKQTHLGVDAALPRYSFSLLVLSLISIGCRL